MEDKNIAHRLGVNIRHLRKNRGWTQVEFAAKLGCSQSIVTSYENGTRKPPADKLETIACLFSITINDLLGESSQIELGKNARNPKLLKWAEQLEKLPANDRRTVLKMIDGLVAQSQSGEKKDE